MTFDEIVVMDRLTQIATHESLTHHMIFKLVHVSVAIIGEAMTVVITLDLAILNVSQ